MNAAVSAVLPQKNSGSAATSRGILGFWQSNPRNNREKQRQ
jgi:hypothetical protein